MMEGRTGKETLMKLRTIGAGLLLAAGLTLAGTACSSSSKPSTDNSSDSPSYAYGYSSYSSSTQTETPSYSYSGIQANGGSGDTGSAADDPGDNSYSPSYSYDGGSGDTGSAADDPSDNGY
jgi:hypothetical protein